MLSAVSQGLERAQNGQNVFLSHMDLRRIRLSDVLPK
jgi:hypothetical protein